jgi:hypothetical protein
MHGTWGGARITRVVEHVMPFKVDFLAEATPNDIADDVAADPWLVPDFVDRRPLRRSRSRQGRMQS